MTDEQQPPAAVGEALRDALTSLARWLARARTRGGPTPGEAWLLERLAERGPVRMGALADLSHVDRSTMTAHVKRLVDRGWAQRVPEPGDRRVVSIRITDAGRAVLHDVRVQEREALDRALHDWPPEEVARLSALLGSLARAVDEVQSSS